MKKLALLLAVTIVTSSVVGCGCCRRLRDSLNRGAFCGTPAVATPTFVAPVAPAPQPVVLPQAAVQCGPACVPCQPCCDPCYSGGDCCDGQSFAPTSYPVDAGAGFAPGCGCNGAAVTGGLGAIPSTIVDPGPVPPGPTSGSGTR